MTSKLSDGGDMRLEDPQRGSRRRMPQTDGARYQLHVIGSDTTDVVQSIGGWLTDRSMAGWDITVACCDDAELLALRILGVNATSLDSTMKMLADEAPLPALAITGDALARETDLRIHVTEAVLLGMTEFTLWGDAPLAGVDHDMERMRYRVSAAARAFKGHALQAVGLSGQTVGALETFRRGGRADPSMDSPRVQPIRLVRYRDRF
jgi:hypothetical protein